MRFLFLLIVVLGLTGCTAKSLFNDESSKLESVVQSYFSTYKQRKDFQKFMSFYAQEAELMDVIYGIHQKGKSEVRRFLDWHQGEFELLAGSEILTITGQVISENQVVTEGYFHKFRYNGKEMGPWLFVMTQEFNKELKIVKQTDWINYTPRESFLGGQNMNESIFQKVKPLIE